MSLGTALLMMTPALSWGLEAAGFEGPATLFADLNQSAPTISRDIRYADSFGSFRLPRHSSSLGNTVLFDAEDNSHGWELWVSDGTSGGTRQVADINPGLRGSEPRELLGFGGRVVFSADDGSWGRELWATDGTAAGTRRLTDIAPASSSSEVGNLMHGMGAIVFTARSETCVCEIWITDGTIMGTQRLWRPSPELQITPGSGVHIMGSDDEQLLFSITTLDSGHEPWHLSADGTAVSLGDIRPGPSGSVYATRRAVVFQNGFAFNALDAEHGRELWYTAGSPDTTRLLVDILPGQSSSGAEPLGVAGDDLIITHSDAPQFGNLLLARVDESGKVTQLRDDDGELLTSPRFIGTLDAGLVVSVQELDVFRMLLIGGETLLENLEFRPDTASDDGDIIWFRGPPDPDTDPQTGPPQRAIWRSDGTPQGTIRVSGNFDAPGDDTIQPIDYPGSIMPFDSGALYASPTKPRIGNTIWRIDDSDPAAASLIVETLSPNSSSEPHPRVIHQGLIYVTSATFRNETLLQLDSESDNRTELATALMRGQQFRFLSKDGQLFIQAGEQTPTLRVSDPENRGMFRLIWESESSSDPSDLVVSQNVLWFLQEGFVSDGPLSFVSTTNLWRTDGSAAGTELRAQVEGHGLFSTPVLAATDQRLLFEAQGALWASDGSQDGTTNLSDAFGVDLGFPFYFTSLPGEVLFSAFDEAFEFEIWRSDGTIGGTRLFEDQRSGGIVLATNGDRVLVSYSGSGGSLIAETTVSASYLTPIDESRTSAQAKCIRSGDRRIIIPHNDGIHGREPTRYDCRSGEFRLLVDLSPGSNGSNPLAITRVGDVYYYSAHTPQTGRELYRSDLVSGSTDLVADIAPGPASSNAGLSILDEGILSTGEALIFAADDGSGAELWQVSVPRVTQRNLRIQELP